MLPTLTIALATLNISLTQLSLLLEEKPTLLQQAKAETVEPAPAQTVESMIAIRAKRAGISVSLANEIARCESGKKQFEADGRLLRGKINSKDVGIFQVNEKYHLVDSKKLGYNIYTPEGNIDYAMLLLKRDGTHHWNASKHCWQ